VTERGKIKTVKKPDTEDETLWRSAMREVKPLKKDADPEEAGEPAGEPEDATTKTQPSKISDSPKEPPPAAGIDRRTEEKLRQGKFPIEGRLDLHGHTQAQAHNELIQFIERGFERGQRCLLVITGKGSMGGREEGSWLESETGVLRREVPRWLTELPLVGKVIAFTPAQPKHGGEGALYVYLRRKKTRKASSP
jgi:DNA-nicking Smr family endonuclease